MKKSNKPTQAELEILQVLWSRGPSSVREVNDILNKRREVGYTTTLKIMQIMADKGLAERDTRTRTHVYTAAVSEGDTQKQLLDRFLETAFKGSAGKLVMQALGSHEASAEELEKIKALIKKIEDEQST
jgi:BlaI family penicillinase repressor